MVSIIRGGVTFSFNSGDVEVIDSNVSTELDFEAMPGVPPAFAMLFDFNGVTKTITVTGALTNSGINRLSSGNATTIEEQRQWLESSLSGVQSGLTFQSLSTSTYNGSTFEDSKCYKSSIRFRQETGNPNSLPFEITLFVGDV